MNQIKIGLIKVLEQNANEQKAKQIMKYMKNILPYRGIQTQELNTIFNNQWKDNLKNYSQKDNILLAEDLIKQNFGEDKQIGILILNKFAKQMTLDEIKQLGNLFTQNYIFGWSPCDSVCIRVLKPWIQQDFENAKLMLEWAKNENLWMRRASCVAFVNLARKANNELLTLLFEICDLNIKHQERFNQLGCGWLLRNMDQKDHKNVINFIEKNIQYFSAEGLRYAYEKMKLQDQNYLKELRKKNLQKQNQDGQISESESQDKKVKVSQSKQNNSKKKRVSID